MNLIWTHRTQPGESTRADQLALGVAYSMLVRDDTALVVDFVHGAKPESAQELRTSSMSGFRHEISSSLAVGAGLGAGVAQQSPGYRFIFAVQIAYRVLSEGQAKFHERGFSAGCESRSKTGAACRGVGVLRRHGLVVAVAANGLCTPCPLDGAAARAVQP